MHRSEHKPPHMLCHGYQRAGPPKYSIEDCCPFAGIPGLTSIYPNTHVSHIKGATWTDLLNIMGREGEMIMLGLILDCGIFIPVDQGRDNFYQLSGKPLLPLRS